MLCARELGGFFAWDDLLCSSSIATPSSSAFWSARPASTEPVAVAAFEPRRHEYRHCATKSGNTVSLWYYRIRLPFEIFKVSILWVVALWVDCRQALNHWRWLHLNPVATNTATAPPNLVTLLVFDIIKVHKLGSFIPQSRWMCPKGFHSIPYIGADFIWQR